MVEQILVVRPESHPNAVEHLGDRWYMEGRVPGRDLNSLGVFILKLRSLRENREWSRMLPLRPGDYALTTSSQVS